MERYSSAALKFTISVRSIPLRSPCRYFHKPIQLQASLLSTLAPHARLAPSDSFRLRQTRLHSTATMNVIDDKLLVVVFGASGDVAKKMTYPALYALFASEQLPKGTRIIGYARSDLDDEKFHNQITGGLEDDTDKSKVDDFKEINQYVRGAYDEDEAFQNLEKELQKIADEDFGGESNRIYYLALPPSQFVSLSQRIKKNNYKGLKNRLVVEKPFGKDTESCRDMMGKIMSDWTEDDIYRVDHFLGADLARNILHLRFSNENLVEPVLNKEKVGAVVIELGETFGCEGRGGYFDEFGIIRDVIQNHLLQLLLLVAMEKPKSLEGDHLRDERLKVLKSIKPVKSSDAVFGQYVKGNGKPGYLEDESVENKESRIETFASTVLYINNDRWQGVPFILKSGKALAEDVSRVTIQIRPPSNPLFGKEEAKPPTELCIEMIPNNKVYFRLHTKVPGLPHEQKRIDMALDYEKAFPNDRVGDPYEMVMLGVIKGDESLFVREDELLAAWEIFTPLLHEKEGSNGKRPLEYEYGARSIPEADELEKRAGLVTTAAS